MDKTTAVVPKLQSIENHDYETVYDDHVDLVFSRCLFILGDLDQAEDAVQDIMVKIYFALKKFEERSSLKTWIYRITSNHCFNVLKKHHEISFDEMLEDGIQFEEDENLYETLANHSQVTDTLSRLSKDIRAILLLKYADGYSYDEIAEITELSPSAVKMRIHRAKQELLTLNEKGRI